jgi:hypothetical protein
MRRLGPRCPPLLNAPPPLPCPARPNPRRRRRGAPVARAAVLPRPRARAAAGLPPRRARLRGARAAAGGDVHPGAAGHDDVQAAGQRAAAPLLRGRRRRRRGRGRGRAVLLLRPGVPAVLLLLGARGAGEEEGVRGAGAGAQGEPDAAAGGRPGRGGPRAGQLGAAAAGFGAGGRGAATSVPNPQRPCRRCLATDLRPPRVVRAAPLLVVFRVAALPAPSPALLTSS